VSKQVLQNFAFLAGAYLLGCLNTGYYLVRLLRGEDIRRQYSGTAGARNAGRILGTWGFATVLACDMLKGAVGVFAARALGMDSKLIPWVIPALVAGHLWPVQLRFKGGKGLAVSGGALPVYDPFLFLCGGAIVLLGIAIGRFSWGVATFFLVLPLLSIHDGSLHRIAAMSFTSLLVLGAHRTHFRRTPRGGSS
jgi:glycerol-3-phosphate acyltransferase PlsY